MSKKANHKIVIINQAVNYLTVGICNEFSKKYQHTDLITGSIHEQGEKLDQKVEITYIRKWQEKHGIKKFFIYVIATLQIYWLLITKYRRYEVFFISLPPMGYLLNIFLPHKFSMLIWDVYPDVFKITGMQTSHPLYRVWKWMNKKSFKKSHKLFTIGNKTADLLSQYVPKDKIIVSPIWSIFEGNKIERDSNIFIKKYDLNDKFIVQYSGNIGLTHNVEVLIDIAKKMINHPNILFQIIGRGPRKSELEERVKDENIVNCQFLPFQSDEMFPHSLSAANIGVVILDDAISKGSVPSKSYNLMSYGIPSLYIAAKDSELFDYAEKYKHGKCFESSELDKAVKFILDLSVDQDKYMNNAKNAVNASRNFRRENALKFVNLYLDT